MFWDKSKGVQLLQERYPWFVSTFLKYDKEVMQGESRKFMHHFKESNSAAYVISASQLPLLKESGFVTPFAKIL
jgi:hypothetical protein